MKVAGVCIVLWLLHLTVPSTAAELRADRRDGARVIAAFSTWTQLSFVTSTTTVPLTCAAAISNVACKKRKRSFRKFLKSSDVTTVADDNALEGSLASIISEKELAGPERDPKIALTVWRSHTSTFTMLMTSTNLAITFSVSFACSIMGGNFPAMC